MSGTEVGGFLRWALLRFGHADAAFRALDFRQKGQLSVLEFEGSLQKLGYACEAPQALFSLLDVEGNGFLVADHLRRPLEASLGVGSASLLRVQEELNLPSTPIKTGSVILASVEEEPEEDSLQASVSSASPSSSPMNATSNGHQGFYSNEVAELLNVARTLEREHSDALITFSHLSAEQLEANRKYEKQIKKDKHTEEALARKRLDEVSRRLHAVELKANTAQDEWRLKLEDSIERSSAVQQRCIGEENALQAQLWASEVAQKEKIILQNEVHQLRQENRDAEASLQVVLDASERRHLEKESALCRELESLQEQHWQTEARTFRLQTELHLARTEEATLAKAEGEELSHLKHESAALKNAEGAHLADTKRELQNLRESAEISLQQALGQLGAEKFEAETRLQAELRSNHGQAEKLHEVLKALRAEELRSQKLQAMLDEVRDSSITSQETYGLEEAELNASHWETEARLEAKLETKSMAEAVLHDEVRWLRSASRDTEEAHILQMELRIQQSKDSEGSLRSLLDASERRHGDDEAALRHEIVVFRAEHQSVEEAKLRLSTELEVARSQELEIARLHATELASFQAQHLGVDQKYKDMFKANQGGLLKKLESVEEEQLIKAAAWKQKEGVLETSVFKAEQSVQLLREELVSFAASPTARHRDVEVEQINNGTEARLREALESLRVQQAQNEVLRVCLERSQDEGRLAEEKLLREMQEAAVDVERLEDTLCAELSVLRDTGEERRAAERSLQAQIRHIQVSKEQLLSELRAADLAGEVSEAAARTERERILEAARQRELQQNEELDRMRLEHVAAEEQLRVLLQQLHQDVSMKRSEYTEAKLLSDALAVSAETDPLHQEISDLTTWRTRTENEVRKNALELQEWEARSISADERAQRLEHQVSELRVYEAQQETKRLTGEMEMQREIQASLDERQRIEVRLRREFEKLLLEQRHSEHQIKKLEADIELRVADRDLLWKGEIGVHQSEHHENHQKHTKHAERMEHSCKLLSDALAVFQEERPGMHDRVRELEDEVMRHRTEHGELHEHVMIARERAHGLQRSHTEKELELQQVSGHRETLEEEAAAWQKTQEDLIQEAQICEEYEQELILLRVEVVDKASVQEALATLRIEKAEDEAIRRMYNSIKIEVDSHESKLGFLETECEALKKEVVSVEAQAAEQAHTLQEKASKELRDLRDQLATLRKASKDQYSAVQVESKEEMCSLQKDFLEREQILGVAESRLQRELTQVEQSLSVNNEVLEDEVEAAVCENDVMEALLEEECARISILEEANTVQADELQRTVQCLRREGQNARETMHSENTTLSLKYKEELLALDATRDDFTNFERAAQRAEHNLQSQLAHARSECSSDSQLLQEMQEKSGQRNAALMSEVMTLRQVLADTEMSQATDTSKSQVLEVRMTELASSRVTTEELVERANSRYAEAEERLHLAHQAGKESTREFERRLVQSDKECFELRERLQSTEKTASSEILRLRESLTRSINEESAGRQLSEQHLNSAETELRNVLEDALLEGQEQKEHIERSERLWQRRVRGLEEELSTVRAEMLQQEDLVQDLRGEDRLKSEALAGEISSMANGVRALQQKHNASMATLFELRDGLSDRSKVLDKELQSELINVPAGLAAIDAEILAVFELAKDANTSPQ